MEPGIEDIQQDWISGLPECVISHILSFLPTKSAFATSFLAKNWKLRWTKVSTLRFDGRSWPYQERSDVGYLNFAEFVNMVFITHTGFLEKLLLRWRSDHVQPNYLCIWVRAAIAKNLRVLDLATSHNCYYESLRVEEDEVENYDYFLPDALYSCRTLEVLKLQGAFIVELPRVVCLPKLQKLRLIYVKFECEFVEKLISASPVLHTFAISKKHYHEDLVNLKVSSPSLKRLEVRFDNCCSCTPYPSYVKLVIDTPALEFLLVNGPAITEISCIQDRLPVNELEIDVLCQDGSPQEANSVVRFVQACDGVKIMGVKMSTMFALNPEKPNIGLSATFQKLTRLTAVFSDNDWCSLLDLIDRSVNLEVLNLWQLCHPKLPLELECNRVPACLSSSLKHLSFRPYGGRVSEMSWLKFILKHGLLMETVTLCSNSRHPIDGEEKLNMLNKVLMLPRASATCKIVFS